MAINHRHHTYTIQISSSAVTGAALAEPALTADHKVLTEDEYETLFEGASPRQGLVDERGDSSSLLLFLSVVIGWGTGNSSGAFNDTTHRTAFDDHVMTGEITPHSLTRWQQQQPCTCLGTLLVHVH